MKRIIVKVCTHRDEPAQEFNMSFPENLQELVGIYGEDYIMKAVEQYAVLNEQTRIRKSLK